MAVPADSSSSLFTPSEPLDRSPLLRGGDVSSARRRRRRSTKKVEARGLAQSQGGLELSSLESFGSSKTQTRSKVSYSNDRIEGAADGLGVTRSSNNIDLQGAHESIDIKCTERERTKEGRGEGGNAEMRGRRGRLMRRQERGGGRLSRGEGGNTERRGREGGEEGWGTERGVGQAS